MFFIGVIAGKAAVSEIPYQLEFSPAILLPPFRCIARLTDEIGNFMAKQIQAGLQSRSRAPGGAGFQGGDLFRFQRRIAEGDGVAAGVLLDEGRCAEGGSIHDLGRQVVRSLPDQGQTGVGGE
jgi:hypothetical protein